MVGLFLDRKNENFFLQQQDLGKQVVAQKLQLADEFIHAQKAGREGARNILPRGWSFSTVSSDSIKYADWQWWKSVCVCMCVWTTQEVRRSDLIFLLTTVFLLSNYFMLIKQKAHQKKRLWYILYMYSLGLRASVQTQEWKKDTCLGASVISVLQPTKFNNSFTCQPDFPFNEHWHDFCSPFSFFWM